MIDWALFHLLPYIVYYDVFEFRYITAFWLYLYCIFYESWLYMPQICFVLNYVNTWNVIVYNSIQSHLSCLLSIHPISYYILLYFTCILAVLLYIICINFIYISCTLTPSAVYYLPILLQSQKEGRSVMF